MSYLSQDEIDALVGGAADSDGMAAVVPAAFNFNQPPRLLREQEVALSEIHWNIARSFQELLATRLREPVDLELGGIELISFGEVRSALGESCASWSFVDRDGGYQGLLDLDRPLTAHMIDRLLGGPGKPDQSNAPPTQLELSVLRGLISQLLTRWHVGWEGQLPASAPQLEGFEANCANLRLASPEEIVLAITLVIRIGELDGLLTLVTPATLADLWSSEVGESGMTELSSADLSSPERRKVVGQLMDASVSVAARLPGFRLTAREVAGLKTGQIVETGSMPDGAVVLQINGKALFQGNLGRHQGAVALRVTGRFDKDSTTRNPRRRVISE